MCFDCEIFENFPFSVFLLNVLKKWYPFVRVRVEIIHHCNYRMELFKRTSVNVFLYFLRTKITAFWTNYVKLSDIDDSPFVGTNEDFLRAALNWVFISRYFHRVRCNLICHCISSIFFYNFRSEFVCTIIENRTKEPEFNPSVWHSCSG